MATTSTGKISVVIPCYNSGDALRQLVDRLHKVLSEQGLHHEVILVNDGCIGAVSNLLRSLAQADYVSVLELARNVGQQNAVMCGMQHADGDLVITLDDDYQHRPEDIPPMIELLESSDLDVVIAKVKEKQHGRFRTFATAIVRRLSNHILNLNKPIAFSSFRVIRGEIARRASAINHPTPVVGYQLLQVTSRVENFEVEHLNRTEGSSNYSFYALFRYFLVMIFEHSLIPLQFVAVGGFVAAVVAVILGIGYIIMKLVGVTGASGFTTIVVLTTIFSGLILGSLAVIGNYLLRSLRQTGNVPRFFVRSHGTASPPRADR